MTADEWESPAICNGKVDKGYGKRDGVIMFPTSHDITRENISQYCCVLRKLLDAGNEVLIVSKPRFDCIALICEGFKDHREKILFRFTIGSIYCDVLEFWEPGAPGIFERLACLKYSFDAGYRTSVSCEPYLDKNVFAIYEACRPYITDSFWIGKMKRLKSRVDIGSLGREEMLYVEAVEEACRGEFVQSMYRLLDGRIFVRWKDSISKLKMERQ